VRIELSSTAPDDQETAMTFISNTAFAPAASFGGSTASERVDTAMRPPTPSAGSVAQPNQAAPGSSRPIKDDVARIIDLFKSDPMQAAKELVKLTLREGGPGPLLRRLVAEISPLMLRDLQQSVADAQKQWPSLISPLAGTLIDMLLSPRPVSDGTLSPKPN
jgi:hypothetical protein